MSTKEKILELAKKQDRLLSRMVVDKLVISRQLAAKYLAELVKEGALIKLGKTKSASYILPENLKKLGNKVVLKLKNENLEEHKVLDEVFERMPQLKDLPENILSILSYAFSEMLNNAIDHSGSKNIVTTIEYRGTILRFIIEDLGVGVFRNVMSKYKLKSEFESMQDLLKGKTTTMPEAHSGEGIFFTSKIADVFELNSYGYKLRVDNRIPDVFFEKEDDSPRGTAVNFMIDTGSTKHLRELFEKYETDPENLGFDKTEILVKLYKMGAVYVSRSQAKRILSRLEKFKHVTLDFQKVPTIGQAFADEIFRVFKNNHPEIMIEAVNTNEAVRFMIDRVR